MSDIDDATEWIAAAGTQMPAVNQNKTRGRPSRDYEDHLHSEDEEKVKPGLPTQYSFYGDGYKATTATVATLPSGVYEIKMTSEAVYAAPLAAPSGLLLELPEMRSEEVIKAIERFWDSEKDYKYGNEFVVGGAQFKAGVMIYGPPGCHAKGQDIIMFDGSTKKVEDIVIGDLLMGPDSRPREVLQLCRNRQEMVEIIPTKGEKFVVNIDHILSVMPSGRNVTLVTPINISVRNYLKNSKVFQERMKLYRVGVEFSNHQPLPIPPYILGAWLGDGTSSGAHITSMDDEVESAWRKWGESLELGMRSSRKKSSRALTHCLTNGIGSKNAALSLLRSLDLIKNKHIPHSYLTASRQDRLELLAGLLDTDGHSAGGGFDFIQKNETVAKQVVFLARSLGFSSYISKAQKGCTYKGVWREGTYFRISISGDCSQIPIRILRKKSTKRQQIKDVLRTGFKVRHLPEDNYYGFTVSDDHLYLLGDFTVTHNSGKSSTIKIVTKKMIAKGGTVFYSSLHPSPTTGFLADFSQIEKDRKCIVILEDIDSLIEQNGESGYLEMLDSAKTIDNVLFIATTNYPERLDPRIYNRPGRFSHVIKIGLPTANARRAFLEAILKDKRDIDEIVANTSGFTVDHLSALINAVYREKKELTHEIRRLRTLFNAPISKENSVGFGLNSDLEF